MQTTRILLAAGVALAAASRTLAAGPVAHWDFSEAAGIAVHDRAGGGHDGQLTEGQWVQTAGGGAARFAGSKSYMAVPRKSLLDLAGDATVVAWVKPLASPLKNSRTNYGILATSDYATNGVVIRVEGDSSHLRCVGFREGGVSVATSETPLAANEFHQVVFVKRGDQCQWYLDGRADGTGSMPRTGPLGETLWISEPSQSFDGLIDDVKIFDRALSSEEVVRDYRRLARTYGRDVSQFGTIRLTPFLYLRERRAMAEVDFSGVLPLENGERVVVDLAKGDAVVENRPVTASIDHPLEAFLFDLSAVPPGRYEVRARLLGQSAEKARAVAAFEYPAPAVRLVSPRERTVPALPAPPPLPPLEVVPDSRGGFTLRVGEKTFPIESRFSFPKGGENVLGGSDNAGSSPQWKPVCTAADGGRWCVTAECPYYRVRREIDAQPHRVLVRDTISNLTPDALGIILRNQVLTAGKEISALLAGEPAKEMRDIKINPTVFIATEGIGLGLIALDDVYVVQAHGFCENGRAGILTREFALDGGARYTLEWAIYPNAGDYYDFINRVRRDENRGGVTVEGGFAFYPTGAVPSREYLEIRGLRYFSAPCLSRVVDDPAISLEGIEFLEYPKIRGQLREQFAAVTALDPAIRCMFHIAHALYATDKPEEKFPDARLVDAGGRQHTYGDSDAYYYGGDYFAKERLDRGWRWWIFYPTRENSFGKALLESVDVMVDEIGCRGAFMDGFMWTYGSEYTYNQWDGHSADIDPQSKTITRKKGSVLLLSQDVLADYVRKFNQRGGTVIANYPVFTRTIAREKMVCDQECRVGPDIHLTHTPITLGRSGTLHTERHVYRDVREALANGNLYFYYGEGDLGTKSVPAYMYPITIEEIHAGCVLGRERIVTSNAGVYGWRGDADLHQVWFFDGRGGVADHGLFSTVDGDGVRTELPLGDEETAVIRRIPVRLEAASPVNVHCAEYSADRIRLILHGHGEATMSVRNGEFETKAGAGYRAGPAAAGQLTADAAGVLTVPLALDGQSEIVIERGPSDQAKSKG
ncbi:MAG: LamG domain-containing protein [Pirellulales bacterium]|nr:LamG domain-containing protein [Pirellulales bacterium]